jgi:hypothetical protein
MVTQVHEVNRACKGNPSFVELSGRGGTRRRLLDFFRDNTTQAQVNEEWNELCMFTPMIGVAFLFFSLALFFIISGLMVYFRFTNTRPPWLSAADFTMDICRSRLFTAAGVTWLLYSYYSLLFGYFVNSNSGAYQFVVDNNMPLSIYFLILRCHLLRQNSAPL